MRTWSETYGRGYRRVRVAIVTRVVCARGAKQTNTVSPPQGVWEGTSSQRRR